MTGTLSQLIALVSFGNNFIKTWEDPIGFYPANPAFQFCNLVDFRMIKPAKGPAPAEELVIAPGPVKWFRHLKSDGCIALRLYFEGTKDQSKGKDHQLAGFIGGGGTWLIETIYPRYSNYWASRWTVTRKDDTDNKIWTVNYGLTVALKPTSNLQFDLENIKNRLDLVLHELTEFANRTNKQNWANIFEAAAQKLSSDAPITPAYNGYLIVTENYSLLAQQVLTAASAAYVFGGMGSWNDLSFDTDHDNELYDSLSVELYDAINQAIIAAVNSF